MAYETVLTALADPTRRAILESLRVAPQSVADLAASQPVSRPAVSQHLKVLLDADLVCASSAGTRRIYSVERKGLVELRSYIDSYWSDVLSAFSAEVDKQNGE